MGAAQGHRVEYARAAREHKRGRGGARLAGGAAVLAQRLQRVEVQPIVRRTEAQPECALNELVGLGGGDVAKEVREHRRDRRDRHLPEGVGKSW